jgi:hypothetical protein
MLQRTYYWVTSFNPGKATMIHSIVPSEEPFFHLFLALGAVYLFNKTVESVTSEILF